MTRLRAFELLGDARCREEALVALATTERDSAAALRNGSLSYCLCHGLGGNADVLLQGRRLLPRSDAGGQLPEAIGTAGMNAYGKGRRAWPCGIPVPGRETPGLMMGLAGIGAFYLRLAFPAVVPSPLLLCRQSVRDGLARMAASRAAPGTNGSRSRATKEVGDVCAR